MTRLIIVKQSAVPIILAVAANYRLGVYLLIPVGVTPSLDCKQLIVLFALHLILTALDIR